MDSGLHPSILCKTIYRNRKQISKVKKLEAQQKNDTKYEQKYVHEKMKGSKLIVNGARNLI